MKTLDSLGRPRVRITKPGSTQGFEGVVIAEDKRFVDVTTKHPYHDSYIITLTYRKEGVEYI